MHKLTTIIGSGLSEVTLPKDNEYRSAALGLWEGLSHSALLRSIVIVLNSHSALLRSIVIVLKVVAAKSNWWGKNIECEFRSTSLLPNKKYEFKIVLWATHVEVIRVQL